jgi:hypothetical protein
VGRLRDYAYVARQIPPSMREEGVYWSAYRELASIKDTGLQLNLFDQIKTEGMTTRQVAEAKRSEEHTKGSKQEMATCPSCYGSGLLLPHKAEKVKRVLDEFDYHDELT